MKPPQSPNQVCASGVRISSAVPQGESWVGSIVTVSIVISWRNVTAQKAPSMNSAPCAKLTTPSVPKTSVRPRAISA